MKVVALYSRCPCGMGTSVLAAVHVECASPELEPDKLESTVRCFFLDSGQFGVGISGFDSPASAHGSPSGMMGQMWGTNFVCFQYVTITGTFTF